MLIIILSINSVNALDNATQNAETSAFNSTSENILNSNNENILSDASSDLENKIKYANQNEEILINPGTYKIHNVQLTKNITLQGNGNPRDIIIDGEEKSSIFLISHIHQWSNR